MLTLFTAHELQKMKNEDSRSAEIQDNMLKYDMFTLKAIIDISDIPILTNMY
jgi:hypothetical protein